MAQRVITQLVDDIDGKELKEGDGETLTFSLDGTSYELDLSHKNADKFRGLFQDYIAAGRKVGRAPARKASKAVPDGPSAKEIREWAKDQGLDVPERGRITAEVKAQYEAAH